MTVRPWTPSVANVFKSDWIPAPADGSDPAMDNTITNLRHETHV